MGWGEARTPVDIDARLTVLQDVVVLRKHGDISQTAAVAAITAITPALIHHLGTLPDDGTPLPAWLEHEIRLLCSKG